MNDLNRDRVIGATDKLIGNRKETAGKLAVRENLQYERQSDQLQGSVKDLAGTAKQSAQNQFEKDCKQS